MPETRLFAVGDPNQRIYSWRGSSQSVFKDFLKKYQATEISLPINYRSTSTILSAAKCFLGDKSHLEGIRDQGSGIVIRKHYDPFNEAEYLAGKIARLHADGFAYREIAILYRLQRQTVVLGNVFQKAGIPYEVSMRKTLKDIPVLQWLMRLLKAATNRNDSSSLASVLTDGTFGEGLTPGAVRKLQAGRQLPDGEASRATGTGGGVGVQPELLGRILGFAEWGHGEKDAGGVYGYFDLDSHLRPTSSGFTASKAYVAGMLEKLDGYTRYKHLDLTEGTIAFINAVALHGIDVVNEDAHADTDTVRLMTLHACKGLEFKHVFIIGANQGLIPLGSCMSEDEEAEEKRLFFVGLTRAKDCLELSYYTSPDELRVMPGPSGYLSMIPANLTSREEGDGAILADVDMRALRREVREGQRGKAAGEQDNAVIEGLTVEQTQKVMHERYGVGVVESEDADTITVQFEAYGIKSFSKAFNPLSYIPVNKN